MSDLDFKVKNGLTVNNNLLVAANGKISVNTSSPLTSFHINSSDALFLPTGNTANRPTANDGMIRYNTDLHAYEGSINGNWLVIAQESNNTVLSNIQVSEIDFDSSTNTKIKSGSNTISLYTSNNVVLTVSNTSFQTYSLTVNNSSMNVNNMSIANVSSIYIGNNSVNAVINSTSAKFSNSTSSFTLTIPTSNQAANNSYFLNANGQYGIVVFSPYGSNTEIQFNDSGSWGSTAGFTFDKTSNNLSVANTITATTFTGNLHGTANNSSNLGNNPPGYYANTTFSYYIGTTLLAINRTPDAINLTGVSIDGSAGSAGVANNSLFLGGKSVGTSNNNIIALDSNAKLPAVDGSQLLSVSTPRSGVRQVIITGPSSSGSPSILASTYASLTVNTQNISSNSALIVSAANGFTTYGDNDYVGSLSTDISWTVAASNTSYLPVSVSSSGVVAAASPTTRKPIYQLSGTPATTNGQYTFNIQEMKMYLGNGSVANQVNHVILGFVISNATTITSTVAYAYGGYYESDWVAGFPAAAVAVSKNHNIGSERIAVVLQIKVTTAIGGYAVGDILDAIYIAAGGPAVPVPVPLWHTDLACGFIAGLIGSYGAGVPHKSTGAGVGLAGSSSVSYRLIAWRL